LTSSFPIFIPFISFSCLTALDKNPSIILNKSGESGLPCLIPHFRGNGFTFSPFTVLAVAISYSLYYSTQFFSNLPCLRDNHYFHFLNQHKFLLL
jgi:hypothetical protein